MNNDIHEAAAALVKKHGVATVLYAARWLYLPLREKGNLPDIDMLTVNRLALHDAALLAAREDEAGMIQSALADAREETMLAERERCAEILLAKQTELDDEVERLCGSDAHVHEYFFCGDASVIIGFLVDAIRNPQAASNE